MITNPPFSQNYDKASLAHTERFVYGYTPEGGKEGRSDVPAAHAGRPQARRRRRHGHAARRAVPRGGAEGTIRRRIIEEDLLDCVIGLGPNLFYGTGIPAAILILRAKGSKPPERRCKVLFINADRDYGEGRAQNHLAPRAPRRGEDHRHVPRLRRRGRLRQGRGHRRTGRQTTSTATSARYADNAPPPEPQDVRAHLHGGVPTAEIDDAADLLQRAGLDADALFVDRGERLRRLAPRGHVSGGAGMRRTGAISHAVAERAAASPWPHWWANSVEPILRALPGSGILVGQTPATCGGLHGAHDNRRRWPCAHCEG